jgi:hypothetical protein
MRLAPEKRYAKKRSHLLQYSKRMAGNAEVIRIPKTASRGMLTVFAVAFPLPVS